MKYIKTYESIKYKSEDILNCAWYFEYMIDIGNINWRYEMIDLKNKRERYIKYFFSPQDGFTNEKKAKYSSNKIRKYFKDIGLNTETEKYHYDSFENDCISVVLPIQQVREFREKYEIMKTAKKYNL